MFQIIDTRDNTMAGAVGSDEQFAREQCVRLNAREGWDRFRVAVCGPRVGQQIVTPNHVGRSVPATVLGVRYLPRARRVEVQVGFRSMAGVPHARWIELRNVCRDNPVYAVADQTLAIL